MRTVIGERVLNDAATSIGAALSGTGEAPSRDTLRAADSHARALGRSRQIAAMVGLASEHTAAADSVRQKVTAEIDGLVAGARASTAPRAEAEAGIHRAIRIVELVDGPQEAQQLLRKVRQTLGK